MRSCIMSTQTVPGTNSVFHNESNHQGSRIDTDDIKNLYNFNYKSSGW